jgi:hypothetical protein
MRAELGSDLSPEYEYDLDVDRRDEWLAVLQNGEHAKQAR